MTVRLKLALAVFASGLVTALLVVATVVYSFQRFENETAYRRGMSFLNRVVAADANIIDLHAREPKTFDGWLRNLVLFEPDTQLYLLDREGTLLASSGSVSHPPGFSVRLGPVLESIGRPDAPFVMGDDPERMDAGAVVAAKAVQSALERGAAGAGYLYLVLHTQQLPEGRWDVLRSSFARPALVLIAAVVAFTTVLALLLISQVTQPLFRLTRAVATLSQRGLEEGLAVSAQNPLPAPTRDEFGQLTSAFEMLLDICRRQWNALRRVDHFRREGVSNLSHDLRSPLTAAVACLETLDSRWAGDAARADDRQLVEVALRNTRNAARLVQSLGDLAKLDEPEFRLRTQRVDAGELLDDICIRFAERAARQGVTLSVVHAAGPTGSRAEAALDIELFERALANLIDNALKFCPRGAAITLAATAQAGQVSVSVADTGPGIAAADLPHLFDRFYQSRQSVAPATGDGGKGLGLAIVKRIAELHGGDASVANGPAGGTRVVLVFPVGPRSEADDARETPRAPNSFTG